MKFFPVGEYNSVKFSFISETMQVSKPNSSSRESPKNPDQPRPHYWSDIITVSQMNFGLTVSCFGSKEPLRNTN